MNQESKLFDVIIVGGGLAGSTLALALAQLKQSQLDDGQPLRIALVEAVPFRAAEQPSFDDRSIALAYSSQQLYHAIGLWPAIEAEGVSPILDIHVSDRGHCGVTRLSHQEERVPALGYVVENRVLGKVLSEQLKQHDAIELFCPASIIDISSSEEDTDATVTIEHDGESLQLHSKLVVAADGGNSKVRELFGLEVVRKQYEQSAIIANLRSEYAHAGTAYERFTDSGPLAILPLSDDRCSLVWTANSEELDEIMALDDEAFAAALQQRFGYRLGRITQVGKRVSYPLSMMTMKEYSLEQASRTVFLGNAAHTVHPVAGQGFNLGLRDIALLVELLNDAMNKQQDIGSNQLLSAYQQGRRKDIKQVTTITDGLISLFSNQNLALAAMRNLGLLISDITPLRHSVARQAMGLGSLGGRVSRLSRGVSL